MCNPRRILVTATRRVAEAWAREVRRTAQRSGTVTAEVRMRQPLDASVGAPALAALERALDGGIPGWAPIEGGYRHDVEGGYVIYALEDRSLVIVATESDAVRGEGDVTARLSGRVEGVFEGQAGSMDLAEARINEQVRERLRSEARAAEARASSSIAEEAARAADADFEARAASARRELERAANDALSAVGARARRVFHALLARAYRDALLAMARHRGAQAIHCSEDGDVLEIEFELPR